MKSRPPPPSDPKHKIKAWRKRLRGTRNSIPNACALVSSSRLIPEGRGGMSDRLLAVWPTMACPGLARPGRAGCHEVVMRMRHALVRWVIVRMTGRCVLRCSLSRCSEAHCGMSKLGTAVARARASVGIARARGGSRCFEERKETGKTIAAHEATPETWQALF